MNNPLGVSPSKGKQGTNHTRQRKNLLTSVGIEPTTSGLDLPSLCRLSYKVAQRKPGTILDGESRRRESNPYFLFAAIHHLKSCSAFSVRPCSSVGRVMVDLIRRSWVRFPPRSKDFFLCLVWLVPCFPLLGLTPSGLFMGLSSTIIYTSELILCSTICVSSATRHNIHSIVSIVFLVLLSFCLLLLYVSCVFYMKYRHISRLCKWSRTGGQNNNKKWCLAPKGLNFLCFVLQLRYIFTDMKRVYKPNVDSGIKKKQTIVVASS